MEYLENAELEELSSLLSKIMVGSSYIAGKLEAFSSKNLHFRKHSKSNHKRKVISGNEIQDSAESSLSASGPDINSSNVFEGSYLQGNFLKLEKSLTDESFGSAISPRSPDFRQTAYLNSDQELKRIRSSSFSTVFDNQGLSTLLPNSIIRKPSRRRTSSLGDLSEPSSRALFMNFIFALNEAFPDYDFNYVKIEQFKDESVGNVIKIINNSLAEVTMRIPNVLQRLWSVIDEIIMLKSCEVFQYLPDLDDEAEDASLWNFHYFFFNKDINRLIYFTCASKSSLRGGDSEGEDSDSEMEYEENNFSQEGVLNRSNLEEEEDEDENRMVDDDDDADDDSTRGRDW